MFGAGAVGGHLAARLARGGAEVSVVARGAHLAAIRERGLRVEAKDGTLHAAVAASDDPAALGPQEMVLVTVKAPALPAVAAGIGPLLGAKTPVVFVMNGIPWWYFHKTGGGQEGRRLPRIDPDDAVWRAVGPGRAIGGVVYSACTVIAPGVVEVETDRNRLVLGEPDGRLTPRVENLAEVLRAGGFAIDVTADIRTAIWAKLALNLVSGPLSVLSGHATRDAFAEPACREAARVAQGEALAIAAALGCRPDVDPEKMLAQQGRLAHKASILQDLELGRPMEVAALFEAPLELARMAGVATPMLDLLVALARLRAKAAGLVGS